MGWFCFQIFWIPTPDNTWLVYIMAVGFGIIDSILGVITQGLHSSLFPDKREFALSAVNMYNTLGWGIQYAWSTSICVETKVYIHIGVLTFGMICYTAVYFLYPDELRLKNTNKIESELSQRNGKNPDNEHVLSTKL